MHRKKWNRRETYNLKNIYHDDLPSWEDGTSHLLCTVMVMLQVAELPASSTAQYSTGVSPWGNCPGSSDLLTWRRNNGELPEYLFLSYLLLYHNISALGLHYEQILKGQIFLYVEYTYNSWKYKSSLLITFHYFFLMAKISEVAKASKKENQCLTCTSLPELSEKIGSSQYTSTTSSWERKMGGE